MSPGNKTGIFPVRPDVELIKCILEISAREEIKKSKLTYQMIWIPNASCRERRGSATSISPRLHKTKSVPDAALCGVIISTRGRPAPAPTTKYSNDSYWYASRSSTICFEESTLIFCGTNIYIYCTQTIHSFHSLFLKDKRLIM